jgi:hypothetical protein
MLNSKNAVKINSFLAIALLSTDLFAETSFASMSKNVILQIDAIVSLLCMTAYLSGVGFAMAGILQFKTHKDNPQQVPLSKPVVMILVASCLLFLPVIIKMARDSFFGQNAISAATAGGGKELEGL